MGTGGAGGGAVLYGGAADGPAGACPSRAAGATFGGPPTAPPHKHRPCRENCPILRLSADRLDIGVTIPPPVASTPAAALVLRLAVTGGSSRKRIADDEIVNRLSSGRSGW